MERPNIDLLHPVRRAYGRTCEDCRLVTAERRLMGFERRDDLPGAQAPQAWFYFICRGDPLRLPGVCRHNLWGLGSLAALLPALGRVYRSPGRAFADVLAIARSWLKRGEEQQALGLLSEYKHTLDGSGWLETARLLKRRLRWDEAEKIWTRLAGRGKSSPASTWRSTTNTSAATMRWRCPTPVACRPEPGARSPEGSSMQKAERQVKLSALRYTLHQLTAARTKLIRPQQHLIFAI